MSFSGDILSLEVPCEVHAPRVVRAAMAEAYDGGWPFDDGLLVASELVTNAVQHSGCGASHTLTVEVGHHQGNLVISVHDPGISGDVAEPVRRERLARGGRGLRIVEQLALRWGAERPDGYRVWAELAAHTSTH
jgi:hypothetical protein